MESRYAGYDSDKLKQARKRWTEGDEAETASGQPDREKKAIIFESGDQWPDAIKEARKAQSAQGNLPAVPERPMLVINKLKEPIRQILNQERESDIGVEIVAADDFGDLEITPDDTEIQLREGLVRRIQRESHAADARSWAFKRAVIAGRGYYLVMTRYLPGTWNQEVYVDRIYNQSGVRLDPAHEQPDGSDAKWEFIGTWARWKDLAKEYPKLVDGKDNPFTDASDQDFMALAEEYPAWYQAEGDERAVRIVHHWYEEVTPRELALLEDGSSKWVDELPAGVKPVATRWDPQRIIKYCKIAGGILELEETEWAGPDMPIIKVLGDETLPEVGHRKSEGMVEPAMGPAMGFNYMASKQVEVVGLSPLPAPIADPEAIESYESWWAAAATRAVPYRPYRSVNDQQQPFRDPRWPDADPNILPIAQSLAMFDMAIKSTTAMPDPTLGNVDPTLKSGRAIDAVVRNAQLSTSNFMDNLGRSLEYEAKVENGLLYPIYGAKPGRLVRILTGEGEDERILIDDPEKMVANERLRAKAKKVAKLTKDARFNVTVKLAKNTELRREQEASMFGEIIAADPAFMTWFGDLYFKNRDVAGSKQAAERARVMLAPPIQQMLAAKEQGQEPLPPEVQQKMAQMAEQIKAAEGAMQELAEEARGKKMEIDAKAQIEAQKLASEHDLEMRRMNLEYDKAQLELERVRMDNATKIHVAEIAAKTKGVIQAQEMEHEAIALAHTQSHEGEQAALDRENMDRQASQARAHEAALAEGSQDHESREAERARAATEDTDA